MHRIALGIALAALAASSSACEAPHRGQASAAPGPIAGVAFLQGEWVAESAGTLTRETWGAPAGGLMLGTSVTVKGDKAVFFEFMRLEQRTDTVVFIAQPRGGAPVEFALASSTATGATFVNMGNDFPKRITYAREGDTLHATIDDGARQPQGGGPPAQSWRMQRVPSSAVDGPQRRALD